MGVDGEWISRVLALGARELTGRWGGGRWWQGVRDGAGKSPLAQLTLHHAIEPDYEKLTKKRWRSVYWEDSGGGESSGVLRVKGYGSFPAMTPRWHCIDGDTYGYGPGAEALPDAKELRVQIRDRAAAVRKQVAPPPVAGPTLRRSKVRPMPHGVTSAPYRQLPQIIHLYHANLHASAFPLALPGT